MTELRLAGIHHVKFPVTDVDRSLAWYQKVFGAHHLAVLDHRDRAGVRYAVILRIPGVDVPVELRWAPDAVKAIRGYDPVTFSAGSESNLDRWLRHLDHVGVRHSPVIRAAGGRLVVVVDPDGTYLRLLSMPMGGLDAVTMDPSTPDPAGPWLAPAIMRRP